VEVSDEQKRKENSILAKRYLQHFRGRRLDLAGGPVWFTDNGESGRMRRYMFATKRPELS
jgi:hypothetical protein